MRMDRWIIEGHTDVTKLIVAFHNFANAPKKGAEWDMQHALER